MPENNWQSGLSRYGFNGYENDNEVSGVGNFTDGGARHYMPRIGRFGKLDDLSYFQPFKSNFTFGGNNPILNIDLNGNQETIYTRYLDRTFSDPALTLKYQEEMKPLRPVAFFVTGAMMTATGLGIAIEIYGAEVVGSFLVQETLETGIEYITGIPIIIDPFDFIEQAAKKSLYIGSKKIERHEAKRVSEYLKENKTVKRIEENSKDRLPDFEIDGKRVEFKALEPADQINTTAGKRALEKATEKKGVDVIDLDIRAQKGTKTDAEEIFNRFKGTDKGKKFNGEVRIATEDGLVTFKPNGD